jgi:hypothetical protein
MYQKLLSIEQVALVLFASLQPPFPNCYKPDLTCEYHASIAGHNIHTWNAFKKKPLQLIKVRWVTFEQTPSVNVNPLPNHASSSGSINALEVEDPRSLKVLLDKV